MNTNILNSPPAFAPPVGVLGAVRGGTQGIHAAARPGGPSAVTLSGAGGRILSPIFILVTCLLSACSVAPTVVQHPDGRMIASLGASLFEKSDQEGGAITFPNGMQMAYSKVNKDQTGVANMAIGTWGTVQGIIESGAALNEGERIRETATTRRVISDNGVKKAAIKADVQKTAILNPVE